MILVLISGLYPHAARHAGDHRGLCPRRRQQARASACSTPSLRSWSAGLRLRASQTGIRRLSTWQRLTRQTARPTTTSTTIRRGRRRRRRRRPARHARHGRAGPEDRLHHQGLPDALAHGRRAGRHRRLAANMAPDSWQWHLYDTVKGSDWLGDVDAMEYHGRARRRRPSTSLSTTACRSRAPRKARSTSGRSAAT